MSDPIKNIFALIPARSGSKGIPRKNIQKVGGISLIARAVTVAKQCSFINKIVISTDDKNMALEGEKYGVDFSIMRSKELSTDSALSYDVWKDAWLKTENKYSKKFDYSILLEPSSPLRLLSDLEKVISKLMDEKLNSVLTVSPTPAHFSPQKTLMVEQEKIKFYHKKGINSTQRQEIPQYFHRNGLCYGVSRKQIFQSKKIVDETSSPVIIERHVVNIDEIFELHLANWIFENQKTINC